MVLYLVEGAHSLDHGSNDHFSTEAMSFLNAASDGWG